MIEDPLSIKIHFQGAIKETACWHVLLEKVSPDLVDCSCFGALFYPKKCLGSFMNKAILEMF